MLQDDDADMTQPGNMDLIRPADCMMSTQQGDLEKKPREVVRTVYVNSAEGNAVNNERSIRETRNKLVPRPAMNCRYQIAV